VAIEIKLTAIGPQGPKGEKGDSGVEHNNHALLENLDYDNSGHTGYQKELILDTVIGCFLITTKEA
jgi:hypothetical protein